jgi:hypothetical protein
MKRLTAAAGLFVLLAVPPTAHARAQFDPSVNGLRLKGDALKTYDFEDPSSLVGTELTSWSTGSGFFPTLDRTPVTNAGQVAALLTGADDAVEGGHALRLGANGRGLAITDRALLDRLKSTRFEVSLWARADGAGPQLHVVYDKDPANVFGGTFSFATVRAIRTGRETSDGWAEYAASPLDGSVWGVPVAGIVIVPSTAADADASFVVDALEIRRVDGKITEPVACTQQTVDAVCGAEGDCIYGHCISSTVTWGVLPAPAHRAEVAERWILFGTRLIGDRNAAKHGIDVLTPNARAIAKNAVSSRQFFGGMNRLVNLLRDNHTSFGSPGTFSSFSPQIAHGSSSALGACFGVVEKDIAGGGLGYAVFRAADGPITGVALKRGDLLFSIDGRDPKEWVDDVWPRYATTLPNDPASDWGNSANDLSRLIAMRASTVTFVRCASSSACTGDARELITIDVATPAFKAVLGDLKNAPRGFGCTQRFTETVTAAAPQGNGEDPVRTATGPIGETRVSFDGFVGQTTWKSTFTGIFAARPEKVLVDARMGHGGYYDAVEHLFNLLRGTSEPMGVLSMGRGTYDLADPPWLLPRLGKCSTEATSNGDVWSCFQGNANGFYASQTNPPGAASRIAWLNTYDVSANDFMPRLLKGRSGFRIFAPHPTSGAFGAITELPAVLTGWSGGSLQVQDARFSSDLGGAAQARWESGHGVVPDVVVAQKLSHAIDGIDTLVDAASQWLASGAP